MISFSLKNTIIFFLPKCLEHIISSIILLDYWISIAFIRPSFLPTNYDKWKPNSDSLHIVGGDKL